MCGVILNDEKMGFDLPYTSSSSNGAASADHRTVVLVGRTGNGKTAIANSILGRKAFISKTSSSGVTLTTQLHQTHFPNTHQTLTVIHTPGFIGSEILKCFRMASAGFHSILVVFSLRNRFSKEDEAVIHCLKDFFGEKIYDYMILVFTHGDDFDKEEESFEDYFEDYLDCQSSKSLKEILRVCKNRKVLFDNRTKDKDKQTHQRKNLLRMVEEVMNSNGGQSYTNEIVQELQRAEKELRDEKERTKLLLESVEKLNSELSQEMEKSYKEYEEMVEANLILKQQLAEEKISRLVADKDAQFTKVKLTNEMDSLKKDLENARVANEMVNLKKELDKAQQRGYCTIM